MNSRDMQVIGLCRFSYPALGGFQVKHETIEDRIRYLYAEDRLEERFRLFETIALPSLRHQTDPNFDLIIVVGDTFPEKHLERLIDLTQDLPQVHIMPLAPGNHREVMKKTLNLARRDPDAPCLQFRFDDDDAVSVDFVKRLRTTAQQCSGLLKQNRSVAIDFSRGYIAEVGPDGIALSEQISPYVTPALGMYVKGGSGLTIMNFSHVKIHRFMPAVCISDEPMWLRTYNAYNDSRQKEVKEVPVTPLTPEQEAEVKARFGVDADLVRQAFAPDRTRSR